MVQVNLFFCEFKHYMGHSFFYCFDIYLLFSGKISWKERVHCRKNKGRGILRDHLRRIHLHRRRSLLASDGRLNRQSKNSSHNLKSSRILRRFPFLMNRRRRSGNVLRVFYSHTSQPYRKYQHHLRLASLHSLFNLVFPSLQLRFSRNRVVLS